MSQATPVLKRTIRATAAISRGRFVTFAGAHAGAGGAWLGVADHAAAIGQDVAVTVIGSAIVEAAGAIAVGDAVQSSTNGRATGAAALAVASGATAVTSGAANGAAVLEGAIPPSVLGGHALQAATAAGQFIEVLLAR